MSKRQKPGSPVRGRPITWAILAVIFGVILFVRVQDESPDRYVVLDLNEHPPGTATPYVPKRRHFPAFYLVHTPEAEVHVVVRLAPKSRCLVVWDETSQRFEDPCTGSHYDWFGAQLSGQGKSLDRLYSERTEVDRVFIDMGVRFPGPS